MFRRLWSGLPDAPEFPETLEELGYFVNADDEIRSIADPKYYFKYFLNKNTYWNDRQRFAFNTAVQNVVLDRLAALGLEAVRLPRDAHPDEPHVRVLATADLATAARVVVFVGETAQDLGILAHRVVGGPGGVAQGSLVPADAAVAVDTPLAGPDGNARMARVACYGCPVHSAGPSWLTERLFVDAQAAVLAWGEAVARDRAYANPTIDVTYAEAVAAGNDANWADYDGETEVGWGDDEKDDKDKDDKDDKDKKDEKDKKDKKKEVKTDTVNEASGEKMAEFTNHNETAESSGQQDTEAQVTSNRNVGDEVEAVGGQLATTSIHQG
ncbi:mitochondrial 40S ribosomal protein mrp2 [Niveomyces insectorum RCEF 264]|uniref:Mitochondrial 40S ribosomal protein mrp2 n=1 Tax=Niveomyces insectorum RCEF 264 TaxID=1081102 RepID=A0A167TBM1_9HYPO|nr:mitochondrial 40S ribosomal protein mrp2 [Niveomyces insectorum RCEF 264]